MNINYPIQRLRNKKNAKINELNQHNRILVDVNKNLEKQNAYQNILLQQKLDIDDQCKQLWLDVFVATASSSNCTRKGICKEWADYAVKQYMEKFKVDD